MKVITSLSYEELQILQQVGYDMTEYEDALERALRDEIITVSENKMLTNLKDQINSNAIKVANLDQVVDSEEKGMLKVLCEVLDKYLWSSIYVRIEKSQIKSYLSTILDIPKKLKPTQLITMYKLTMFTRSSKSLPKTNKYKRKSP